MQLDNRNTLKQAEANLRLEGLSLSKEVKSLLERSLTDSSITTETILETLRRSNEVYKDREDG